jgi:hypothetical protein
MINAHGRSEEFDGFPFVEEEIGLEWFDFQLKSPLTRKFRIVDHGGGIRMEGGLAAVALDYCCAIDDMIEMPVGQQKQIDPLAGESSTGALGRIEKNSPLRSLIVEAIGVEDPAGEAFEPIHEKMVREMMSRFDFRESVCKLLTFNI